MTKTKKKMPSDGCYTVIKLFENGTTLFDCIPDVWFTDENQDFCFWPPIKGKNVAVRALKQEIPDESWEKYPCEIVKGGFATYSCGRALVRDKCSQKYNTSSAEEHVSAAKFRREHPGLSLGVSGSFEDVFSTKESTETAKNHHPKESVVDETSKNDVVINSEKSTKSEGQNPLQILQRHNSSTSITSHKTASSQDLHVSLKRRRIRSNSHQNDSPKSSRKTSQARGSKSHKERGKKIGSSTGKYKRSASINLPSTTTRGQGFSTSHRDKSTNFDRVDRRIDSQETKGSSGSSSSSKYQRSRSPSRESYSSKGSYYSQTKHSSRKILQARNGSKSSKENGKNIASSPRKHQRSANINLPSVTTRRQSSSYTPERQRSRSPSRQLTSHQSKFLYSDRIDRRSDSQESKRSIASGSYSKSPHSRSCSSQSNSSNGTSFSSQSKHSSRKLSQIRLESKTSQHPSAGIDEGGSSGKNMQNSCSSSCVNQMLMTKMFGEVRALTKTVFFNHQENDRRLTRMEVSINKILVRLGDITRLTTAHSRVDSREYFNGDQQHENTQNYGERSGRQRHEDAVIFDESSRHQRLESAHFHDESSRRRQQYKDVQNQSERSQRFVNSRDQRSLPISSLNELTEANKQLMNRSFFSFLVDREKEFCMPGKNTSVNVVITAYLKRFITLRVRGLLTLKELQSAQAMTLYADFYYVYLFLIEVAREGYKSCNKDLTEKDANESLRIVWGRTKQLLNDEQKKRK